ncbi:hypothetical protein SAMN04488118_12211 [Epibacterium ulvae]|uniref:N-acetyltransferase domain-containing protein n=1 Tax=Epibacterium ulvae TaxID=1156985 RepID=A0A1G5RK08_9RHOB|nr:GNAT family N-acetyltransferase [Epibacterium ulvae]SCZ74140.1 hypothetical protein SAMN04488118_12211 [Epibacterium ulvae]
MPLTLSPILATDRPRLLPVLARYLAETAPSAEIDMAKKASRSINRPDMQSFWITDHCRDVGFAFVLTLPEGQRELSEFTIFPHLRRRGLGREAASLLFTTLPGKWRMGISAASPQAAAFWGTCLSLIPNIECLRTGAPFTELQCKSYCFSIPESQTTTA